MKTLVFGPSGSGKSYMAGYLKKMGLVAFDDCEIEGLSSWYDKFGNKVEAPATASEALSASLAFLWSKKVLRTFLARHTEVYIFGGSGNVFDMLDLFDNVYFLKVPRSLQMQRLRSVNRPSPLMDCDENGPIVWGEWLEDRAREIGISFIPADQSPSEILSQIRTVKT